MGFDSEQTRDGAALFVDFAPVCNSRNTDEPYRIIDDVHHAPVTDPNAPHIHSLSKLFTSRGWGSIAQRLKLGDNTRPHVIR